MAAPAIAGDRPKADKVVVVKSEGTPHPLRESEEIGSFRVAFGADTAVHKQQVGDRRTSAGRYVLDCKNGSSSFAGRFTSLIPARPTGKGPGSSVSTLAVTS